MWHLHKEFLFLFLSPHQCLMKCYISSFLEHFSMFLFSCSESCPTFCNSMHFSIFHLTLNKFLFKSQSYCYRYTYHTTLSFEGYNSMSFSYIYLIGQVIIIRIKLQNIYVPLLKEFCPYSLTTPTSLFLPFPPGPPSSRKPLIYFLSLNFPIQNISYQWDHIMYLYISLLTYTNISLTYKFIFLTHSNIYLYIHIYILI